MFFTYTQEQLDFAVSNAPMERLEKLCKELSDTFHWNIYLKKEEEDSFCWVYKNDKLVHCFSEFDLAKNTDLLCEKIEKIVRSTV